MRKVEEDAGPRRANHRRLDYEPRSIVLSPADWQRVEAGKPVTLWGNGYIYHEQVVREIWRFKGPRCEFVKAQADVCPGASDAAVGSLHASTMPTPIPAG